MLRGLFRRPVLRASSCQRARSLPRLRWGMLRMNLRYRQVRLFSSPCSDLWFAGLSSVPGVGSRHLGRRSAIPAPRPVLR